VLGPEAELDALALAAWSDLVAGDNGAALDAFRAVTEARPEDVAAWEGVRSAADALGDHVTVALASAQLGSLCKDDARGAEHWERAGLVLLEHTEAHDDAEIAFERAFTRDPSRSVAFDKLFRRVRARNEDDKLLGIIDKRLDVADDEQELSKLYWERARVLRKKGDLDAAMAALNDVTMLEREHVGAIALTGEIHIIKKQFAEAAPALARLAALPAAPNQQRLMSGVAAADLYENKLGKPESAHEVLRLLHKAGLSTPPVRERLARLAARVSAWDDAVEVLEILMKERDKREGRVEASRLAMVVYRDELQDALRAEAAVSKLLEDVPDDPEAVELVLTTRFDESFRRRALGRAKSTLVERLGREPTDGDRVAMLAKIAGADGDTALRQATLGALVALGRNAPELSTELAKIDATVPSRPQIVLDAGAMSLVADPDDQGPIAELFALMAETTSLALGPTLSSLGVSKKERVDSRGGHPLRVAIAEWMGALSFETDFELYVGGPDPDGVTGVAGELPALVVGPNIKAPLDVAARSAVAREAFALRRGVTAVRTRDDPTIASLVAAACIEAGASVPQPQYAVFGEVSRAVKKEISRKVRKAIADVAARIAAERPDPRAWASAARRSLDRIAVIAAGDVSIVLSDVLGIPRDRVSERLEGNSRVRDLLAFVLSPSYLEIRKKLGMGVR
jgi:tetratricopeptide (TPR) repeat protein